MLMRPFPSVNCGAQCRGGAAHNKADADRFLHGFGKFSHAPSFEATGVDDQPQPLHDKKAEAKVDYNKVR
jgi:hypothetical protein